MRQKRHRAGVFWATLLLATGAPLAAVSATGIHPWTRSENGSSMLAEAFVPPPGFDRQPSPAGSFAAWLRALPLKPPGTPVRLHTGVEKPRQDVHAAVIDIDTGSRDLQQCADAVMRLRAEYLYAAKRQADIAFNFTGGGRVPFSRYAKGERPDARARSWKASAKADASYQSFRRYLDLVYAYAGTASLEQELVARPVADIEIGDVFIKGGFPGHAVIVVDMAISQLTKAKRFLLAQSYMPAQDIHILKNPANGDGSPWYAPPAGELITPEWTFAPGSLKRWP